MLRRGHDGTVEDNCGDADTRQCVDWDKQLGSTSPPSRVCLDVGIVKRFLRVTHGPVTNRLVEVQWYAPASCTEQVREKGGQGDSGSDSAMYRRVPVLPPYFPLGGGNGDGSALRARQPPGEMPHTDGSFGVHVSAQHGRLPIVDTEASCSQDRSWCFVDAIYDHALLVAYPTGSLGGDYFGSTNLGHLVERLFGQHGRGWRIVLPSSTDMVIRMGLLGRNTLSVPYASVIGPLVLFAGSPWHGRSQCAHAVLATAEEDADEDADEDAEEDEDVEEGE